MENKEATLRNMFWTGRQFAIAVGYLSEARPFLFTQVTFLSATCIEIYLKTALSMEDKKYGKDHDLDELFKKLSLKSQLAIEAEWGKIYDLEEARMLAKATGMAPILTLRDALKEGARAFHQFRYAFEVRAGGYNLNRLIDALEAYFYELRPAWRSVFPHTRAPRPAPKTTLELMRDFPEIFGKDVTPE